MLSLIIDQRLTLFSLSTGSGNFLRRLTKGKSAPTDLRDGSVPSSDSMAYSPSSSEEKDDIRYSDPLLLKELDERKSRVSKKALSSSSVSSSAASTLSLSSSDSVALSSEKLKSMEV